ncbi:MAG TPA: NTP transferase domain-containing protein [Methanocorpusculum sp.]|nr:NTP transferase domain-containing protein [Methanocorpusculum sp.]
MLALILAGGEGSRLRLGEKALVLVHERPMIAWVLEAFWTADCEPIVVTSYKTPFTRNWCRANDVEYLETAGDGYVADLAEAVDACGVKGSLFTSSADIPCLTHDIIGNIRERHVASGFPACSSWVPVDLCESFGINPHYQEIVDGVLATPSSVNILTGRLNRTKQNEYRLLLHEPGLVFNINTREELQILEHKFDTIR